MHVNTRSDSQAFSTFRTRHASFGSAAEKKSQGQSVICARGHTLEEVNEAAHSAIVERWAEQSRRGWRPRRGCTVSTPSSNHPAPSGTFLRAPRKLLCRDRKRIPGLVKETGTFRSVTREMQLEWECGRRTRDDKVEVLVLDMAYRNAESVDALQDEIFRPRPSQVADGVEELHHPKPQVSRHVRQFNQQTRRTVMYVPPIKGSAIWVWNAEIPTNCTVLKVQPAKSRQRFSSFDGWRVRPQRTKRNWTRRCTRRREKSTKSRCRRRGNGQ